MKTKKLAKLLSLTIILACYLIFMFPDAKAATAGSLGSFQMPQNGYVTSIYAEAYDPWNNGGSIYLKEDGNTIATATFDGYSWGASQSVTSVFVYAGHTYTLEATSIPDGSVTTAYVNYTPYFLISVSSAYGNPTESAYVQQGAEYQVSVTSPHDLGNGVRAVCTGYSIDGGASQSGTSYLFSNIQAGHTITFNWQIQYQVTYTATGLDASAQGTIVTVDGTPISYGSLPYQKWVNSGAQTSFSYASTVSSSTTGKQFRLYSAVSSPQTITSPTYIQDGYTIQYLLTISTVRGTPVGEGWYDAGSTAYAQVTPTTIYSGDYTRYNFASWTGSGSGSYTGSNTVAAVTMNAPITQTANWATQHYVNIVGVYASTSGSGWYNEGATCNFDVTSPVAMGEGSRLNFAIWTGSGSGSYTGGTKAASCTVNAPITETANWVTQYYFTVNTAYGTATGAGWYNSGATVYAGVDSGTVSGGSGTRYNFVSWSVGGNNYQQSNPVTLNGPATATANWSTQYYLTVNSPYAETTGAGWYNSGSYAYASVSTNVVVGYTFQGWTGGASGAGTTSNPILMNSPKTATAVWSATGGGTTPTQTDYTVTLRGPYYENGMPAANTTVQCTLLYANNTVYSFQLTSTVGEADTKTITSTSPFIQLQWWTSNNIINNNTRVYRFLPNQINSEVYVFIVPDDKPSFTYTFSVSDFYGMSNPYLEVRVNPYSNTSYVVERAALSEGGTVTFYLTQYQLYSLVFVCDQGTYSQTFTPQILGLIGQYPVNLNVMAGHFQTNIYIGVQVEANRINGTVIAVTFTDQNQTTNWVYVRIHHAHGTIDVTDYVCNTTGYNQLIVWQQAKENVNYYVYVEAYVNGVVKVWHLPVGAAFSLNNPWLGVLDFLGQHQDTVPQVHTGWPLGMTTAHIAQLIGASIVMLFLCIGSFRSAGACCIISWLIFGILLVLGWLGVVTPYTIPMFAISGFLALLIAVDEGKQTVREV